ncbi:AAA family ATPase [Vibrio fluvialis]
MSNFYIENLHLRGVRHFDQLDVQFSPKFNFIVGPNGCGKTSILASISHCFSHQSLKYSRFKDDAEMWVDLLNDSKKYRVGMGRGSISSGTYRAATIFRWSLPKEDIERKALLNDNSMEKTLPESIPLFIGSQRNIQYTNIQGMSREPDIQQSRQVYSRDGIRALYGETKSEVKQWIINRDFIIEKDWAREERANWEQMTAQLHTIGPFDSDFSYIRTGRDLEPVFSVYGRECYLEELSSGYQAVLLIITKIIEWIETTRPEGKRNIKTAQGTVLIDEIDLHLHPEWQFSLRDGLEAIFPKLQFIVTTHSPHVLSSAKANEVIILSISSEKKTLDLKPSEKSFSGWSTDQILADIMGVESLENKLYERLIAQSFELADNSDIMGLTSVLEELKAITHPNDVIVPVLQAKLASLVATNND